MNLQLKVQQMQKLVITPKLKQALAILQYSREELLEKIDDELLNNPLLETEEKNEEDMKLNQLISHI